MTGSSPDGPIPKAPKHNIESGGKIQAIIPQNIEEAFRMALSIFRSRMYPDSYGIDANGLTGTKKNGPDDPEATTARIMIGIQKSMEVGFPPISGLSNIYIVNNRPTIFGDGIPALLWSSGKITKFQEVATGTYPNEDYTWTCTIQRKDQDEPTIREFSMADAKKAGLLSKTGPWTTNPKRQLQMRARGFCARDGAADILNGLGIYEEAMDIPEPTRKVDTSSLDDETPPADDQKALSAPDNSNVMPDLQLEEETVTVSGLAQGITATITSNSTGTIGANSSLDDGPTDEEAKDTEETVAQVKDALSEILDTPADKCLTCHGRGTVPFTETEENTGEVTEGIEPCPICKPKKS